MSVLLCAPPSGVDLDESERMALAALAEAGMVPQLRLVAAHDGERSPLGAGSTQRAGARRAG